MASPTPGLVPRQVLVVDDEEPVAALLARTLAAAGYPVITAENGEDALALATAMNGQLALVVTDIRMPGMDGLELASHLAQLHPAPPVLFISGYWATDADIPGPFLRKPFRPVDLVDQASRMIDAAARREPRHK